MARAIILGCGSSGGVPRADGSFGGCDLNQVKNWRTRCSLAIEIDDKLVVIDISPDFRMQMIKNRLQRLDYVLFTHDHADQCHGIDDVRAFFLAKGLKTIPAFAESYCYQRLQQRFEYCFTPHAFYPAIMNLQKINTTLHLPLLKDGGVLPIEPIYVQHGTLTALGYRIAKLAYIPDVSFIDQQALGLLQGLDVLIIDALRYRTHPTHAHIGQALSWIGELKPKQAILTNLHQDLDYNTLEYSLKAYQNPPLGLTICPAHDGMVIEFTL